MGYPYYTAWAKEGEALEAELIHIGRDYMQGTAEISAVQALLNGTKRVGHFTRAECEKFVRRGVKFAIQDGQAIASRLQPEQEPGACVPLKRVRRARKAGGTN